ncbi:MAG TPA: hypothetical protein VHE35_15815 [Kofleriaceae bacterium]|nr:hypothetical protein [Kofleriaceae bacterium]
MTTTAEATGTGGELREPASLSWRIEEEDGRVRVTLAGEIDEHADFTPLRGRLRGVVELELGGVRRINSCGVREWVNFVRDLPEARELYFRACSTAFVTQLNMIYNFRGPARILSFHAPYVCDVCGHDEDLLVEVGPDGTAELPSPTCSRCGDVMQFDDLPERYLSFLHEG